jgi:hypothetical protein
MENDAMTDIPGATASTFVLTTDQLGESVFCTVTATNAYGVASADSNTVGPVTNPATALTTWNPADKTANFELSGGNLIAQADDTGGFVVQEVRGTTSHSTGKYYFEVELTSVGNLPDLEARVYIGVGDSTHLFNNTEPPGVLDYTGAILSVTTSFTGVSQASGLAWIPNEPSLAGHYVEGAVVGCAVDLDARKIWWYLDGIMMRTGEDPATGTGGCPWGATANAAMFPYVGSQWQAILPVITTANFGSTPFILAPLPTGFVAWG